jgi:hypothetical protein
MVRAFVELLPGGAFSPSERYDEEARKLRPVDSSSPVYALVKPLANPYRKIIQCDGTPSVEVAGKRGYRVLLRCQSESKRQVFGVTTKETWRIHTDLVLFPEDVEGAGRLREFIRWEKLEQRPVTEWAKREGPPVSVYMGKGHGFAWYGNLTIPDQDRIRRALKAGMTVLNWRRST